MTLVPLDADICPNDGMPLVRLQVDQPALFFHGGYGATQRTVLAVCPDPDCGWELLAERSEVRP